MCIPTAGPNPPVLVRVLVTVAVLACFGPPVSGAWRSAWYPREWTPAFIDREGRFLHDFSYAGYRNGEVPLPDAQGPVVHTVEDFGGDATGQKDSQQAIQAAIDAVAKRGGGGVVLLPRGLFRCEGPLRVTVSNTVIRGAGPQATRIFFTSVPQRDWNDHLQLRGNLSEEPAIPLATDARNRAAYVEVEDASELHEGDDVVIGWVISPEFIAEHHMTGTWTSFNDRWRPFFLREIRRIDRARRPHRVHLDVPVRYVAKVRDQASIRVVTGYLRECGVESLSVANAVDWKQAWSRPGVHAISLRDTRDCWIRNVTSSESPLSEAKGYHLQGGGIIVTTSKRITVADCRMEKAQNRGGGGAGYLFHISRSNEILMRDCVAVAGRHNFIQNWDFGSTGLVWLRCVSRDGRGYASADDRVGYEGLSEYHHSLAMACLVDSCVLDDGWFGGNRHDWSSGAGATVTQSVYWNTSGEGRIRSWQTGYGYIIGTRDIRVETNMASRFGEGTEPEDLTEGLEQGGSLEPTSLYEDQLERRLKRRSADQP